MDDSGPIEMDHENVRQEPFTLPPFFVWDEVDLTNKDQVWLKLITLRMNYV